MSAHAATPAPAPMVEAVGARTLPVYTRLSATGLGLIAAAPTIMIVSAAAAGMDMGDAGFFVVLALIPAVAAVLALRFGTWSKIVALVVTVLAALGMYWIAFGLAYPNSFGDFTPGAAMAVGLIAGLGGSIAAIVSKRRGNLATELAGNERRLVLSAVGIVALAGVVSLGLGLATGSSVSAADASGATASTMKDFEFAEETYTVPAGSEAKFVVTNADGFVHNFAIPALNVDPVTIAGGSQKLVTIPAAQPGTYSIYCTLHANTDEPPGGEDSMSATLVVE